MVLHITPGELQALQMLAEGTAPDAIADLLGASAWDVEARLNTLFARMGAATQSDALTVAFRRGLLSPDRSPSTVSGDTLPDRHDAELGLRSRSKM